MYIIMYQYAIAGILYRLAGKMLILLHRLLAIDFSPLGTSFFFKGTTH